MTKTKKILVTGGSGLVGTYLKEYFPDANYLSSSTFNLLHETYVDQLFQFYNPEIVIHLAALVGGIKDNLTRPLDYYQQNLLMGTNLLRAAINAKIPRFIGILSTCIYPDVVDTYPMTEEDLHAGPPPKTNFGYAYAKRALAVHIDACNQQLATKYSYLIPCNLYGEHDKFDEQHSHYVSALLRKIKTTKNTVKLMGTGKPLRQFMHARDLARVITHTVNQDIIESFNVAPNENYSVREIANIALEVTENTHLELKFDSSMPDGQYRKDVSNKKMLRLLPNFQFTPLNQGLKEVYDKLSF